MLRPLILLSLLPFTLACNRDSAQEAEGTATPSADDAPSDAASGSTAGPDSVSPSDDGAPPSASDHGGTGGTADSTASSAGTDDSGLDASANTDEPLDSPDTTSEDPELPGVPAPPDDTGEPNETAVPDSQTAPDDPDTLDESGSTLDDTATSDDTTPGETSSETTPENATDEETEPAEVPEATRGAISLHVVPAGECAIGDAWLDFPLVNGGHPTNGTEHSDLSVDDTRDAEGNALAVTCEWVTLEEPVYVLLAIARTAANGDRGFATLNPKLTVGSTGAGTIQFQRNASEADYATHDAEKLCEYTVIDLDVVSGTVWGSITCASLAKRDDTERCAVSEGYFYFENCRTRM